MADRVDEYSNHPPLKKLDDCYHQVRYALPIFRKGFFIQLNLIYRYSLNFFFNSISFAWNAFSGSTFFV